MFSNKLKFVDLQRISGKHDTSKTYFVLITRSISIYDFNSFIKSIFKSISRRIGSIFLIPLWCFFYLYTYDGHWQGTEFSPLMNTPMWPLRMQSNMTSSTTMTPIMTVFSKSPNMWTHPLVWWITTVGTRLFILMSYN